MINKLDKKMSLVKAKKIYNYCKEFLGKTLLDVGSGRGYIAETIKNQGIKVICLDLKDYSKTDIKVLLYDGEKIPFNDNQFDTVLLAYVLHHCENPINVLKESIRVSKRNIIIFEDTNISALTFILDYLFNKINKVDTPFNFKSKEQWINIFIKHKLKIIKIEENVEKEWFYPFIKHTMFVLKKCK